MTPIFALGMPGLPELLIILLVIVILFGAKKLPELARGLGQSVNEFRKGKDEAEAESKEKPAAQPVTPPSSKDAS